MKGKKADWSLEDYLGRKQGLIVAGCDEVGRGAFAFSLVVAGCAYAPGRRNALRDPRQQSIDG